MAKNSYMVPDGPGILKALVTTAQQPSASPTTVVAMTGNTPQGAKAGADTALATGALLVGGSVTTNATTTAAVIDIYSSLDNGTTKRMVTSVLFPATTVSATTVQTPVPFGFSDYVNRKVAPNELFYAATRVAGSFNVELELAVY